MAQLVGIASSRILSPVVTIDESSNESFSVDGIGWSETVVHGVSSSNSAMAQLVGIASSRILSPVVTIDESSVEVGNGSRQKNSSQSKVSHQYTPLQRSTRTKSNTRLFMER